MVEEPGPGQSRAARRFRSSPFVTSGRALVLSMLVLFVCDVVGGFIGVATGDESWGTAWGFDTESTVPLPIAAVQVLLAWLAARHVQRRVALTAAVVLCAMCLISVLAGLFDGDLIGNVRSDGWLAWGVLWAIVLLAGTAVVGLLAADRVGHLRRLRRPPRTEP
jgi:hypothetical protein